MATGNILALVRAGAPLPVRIAVTARVMVFIINPRGQPTRTVPVGARHSPIGVGLQAGGCPRHRGGAATHGASRLCGASGRRFKLPSSDQPIT
jgi:hypothetical protein